MVTLAEPEALAPLVSVTVNFSSNVPFTGSVLVSIPSPRYGDVPPVADILQSNGLPAVTPELGQTTVTTSGCGAIVTLAEPEAVMPFASVTLYLSVKVPLTGSVTDWLPVPE